MDGNKWKFLDLAENGGKWQKRLEMAGNGWKWMETDKESEDNARE